jgi:hypothetical protein
MPCEDAAKKLQIRGALGGQELLQTGHGKAQQLHRTQRGRHGGGRAAPIEAVHQSPTAGKVVDQARVVNNLNSG